MQSLSTRTLISQQFSNWHRSPVQWAPKEFERVIAEDCAKAGAAMRFILSQDKIGSEMVDNLNASIHLRAVLTDLFLYSEVLRPLPLDGAQGDVQSWDPSTRN